MQRIKSWILIGAGIFLGTISMNFSGTEVVPVV